MSKAKDILEKLKQRREIADAVRAYWADVLPDIGLLPEPQLQSWLGKFDLDAIIAGLDAAVTQRSKRDAKGEPMTATEAVSFASAVMNRLHLESLPEAEQEKIKAHRERIRSVRSSAGKLGNEKRWHSKPEVATVSDDLRSFATPLPPSYSSSVSVSVSSSLSSSAAHSASSSNEESKPAAATPPVPRPAGEEKGGNPKTNTNPFGASGLSANQKTNQPKTDTETENRKKKLRLCKTCGRVLHRWQPHTCQPPTECFDCGIAEYNHECKGEGASA